KVADILVTDDALGTNSLSLSGADAAFFTISGTSLYLKAGTSLDFETQSSYSVTVNVDDATVGGTPDASSVFTLNVTDVDEAAPLWRGTVTAVSGATGTGVFVPLNLLVTEPAGITVAGIDVAIAFDATRFQINPGDVTIASSLQNGLIYESDATSGDPNPLL